MIYAHISDVKNYSGIGDAMSWALSQLASPRIKELPVGKTDLIPGKAWFTIQEPETKPSGEVPYEAHREFIDVQMTLDGEELIGYAPVVRLAATGDYDEDEDIQYFEGKGLLLDCRDGMFAIFFPEDAHQPCVAPKNPGKVKKVVVKIHRSLLSHKKI